MKYAEMLQDGSMSESFSPPNNHTTALREMEMDNRIAESSQTNNKNKNYNSNNKSNNKYIKNSKYHNNNNSKKHNNKSGENVSSSKSSSSNMIGGGNSNENKNNNDKNYTSTSNRNNNNNITNKGMKRIITFYDPESMLSIPETVARGYVTLLCGGEHNHYKKKTSANEQEQARNHFFTSKSNENNNNNNNNDDDVDKTPASTPQKSTSDEDVAKIALAFAALTDGNVIDTCFGVRSAMTSKSITTAPTTTSSTNTTTSQSSSVSPTVQINQRMVRDVKCAIEEAASNNDDIRIVAIEAYKSAFLLLIDGYDKLHRCSIFTRCVKQKKIQKHTLQSLEKLFHEAECIIQHELQM